jgi:hypothetical protein
MEVMNESRFRFVITWMREMFDGEETEREGVYYREL